MARQFLMVLAGVIALASCVDDIRLAPAPNLYVQGRQYPVDGIALAQRTAAPDIFFVTNRIADKKAYGPDRSHSMAFGAAKVRFGEDLTWDEVVRRTHVDTGEQVPRLSVAGVTEVVRFPQTPLPQKRVNGRLTFVGPEVSAYDGQSRAFQDNLRKRIAQTGKGKVLIYVHGFNSEFESSVTTLANIWHFSGRDSIPIAFSWPAEAGFGILGYFRDRDAATFSVFHFKELMRLLAAMPEVDQIDIIAHSRGADLAVVALRELSIFARGQGKHPHDALKTNVLILAAPDLSFDIVRQRLQSERFSDAFSQITLYTNPNDVALQFSELLTNAPRLGSLTDEDFAPGEAERLRNEAFVHFINVEGARSAGAHAYFRDNPAVLSDVVLALQTGAAPGTDTRPLEPTDSGVWLLHSNYPFQRQHVVPQELTADTR